MTMSVKLENLNGDDLTISEHCLEDGIWLTDSVVRPQFGIRAQYAPESQWIAGKALLSAVLDAAELNFSVMVQAASEYQTDVLAVELEDLLLQFNYDVTLSTGGLARTWAAEPSTVKWGKITIGQRALHFRIGELSIPVNPVGAPA